MENNQVGNILSRLSRYSKQNSPDKGIVTATSYINDAFSGCEPISNISRFPTQHFVKCHCPDMQHSAPVQLSTGMQMASSQPDLPLFTLVRNVVSQFSKNMTRRGKIGAVVQSQQNTANFVSMEEKQYVQENCLPRNYYFYF